MHLNEVKLLTSDVKRVNEKKFIRKVCTRIDSLVSETDRNQEIRKVLLNIGP